MQYKNITLALVLLASSAIVTVSASAGESLETKLYDKVVNKKLTQEALAEFTELKPYQVNALLGVEFESAEAIKTAIDTAVNPEELTLEQKILAKVVDKKVTSDTLAGLGLNDNQVSALVAAELTDLNSVKEALATVVVPVEPQSVPSSNEKPQATVENVKNCVGTTGKFNEEELKKINLTEDQITSLMAADFVINDDNIKKIIETTTKPAASAEPIAKPAESTNAVEDLKLKVDAILALVGEDVKMKEMTKEKIAELKLNQKQVDSLKAAIDLSEANIKNILESNAEVDSSSVDSQASGKNEDKWYTSTWFMFFSGAVVLSALGGGAYMMTKKSDETDL